MSAGQARPTRRARLQLRGGFPFRHYAGRAKCGAWLLRSTQISLNEEA